MKDNIIHLGKLSFDDDKEEQTIISSYRNLIYGLGVKYMAKYFGETDNKTRYDLVNLIKIKKEPYKITANKIDCIGKSNHFVFVPASYIQISVDESHK